MAEPPEVMGSGPQRDGENRPLDQARELQASLRNAAPVAAASYALIAGIVLLGGLGYFADGWLGTSPWLLIGGLLLGIVVGFYELARLIWRRNR
jgi:ATP synthase protein I